MNYSSRLGCLNLAVKELSDTPFQSDYTFILWYVCMIYTYSVYLFP